MLENTHATTSYVNGTTINMDAISTKNFLRNKGGKPTPLGVGWIA